MSNLNDVKNFYIDELKDFLLYSEISKRVKDKELSKKLREIAEIERKHAEFWKSVLEKFNEGAPENITFSLKEKIFVVLANFINPAVLISLFELGESKAVKKYFKFLKEDFLSEKEKEKLREIIIDEIEHENVFSYEAERLGLSNVRDFVLGMNDGLVEILGAVTGLSAVYPNNPLMVAVSGSIVGIAGALSMGIGAFISVRSQKQINRAQQEKLEILFEVSPERIKEEARKFFREENFPEEIVNRIIESLNPEILKKFFLKESEENEFKSALFTGIAYLIGVLFPVFPYFLAPNSLIALPLSILSAGTILTVVGLFISTVSGINPKEKVLEMIGAGFGAAGLSFIFGKLIQTLFGVEI